MNPNFAPGIKTFNCETCGKTFKKRSDKNRHMQIHKGIKFPCKMCNKSFSRKDNLVAHISAVHDEDKISCPKCGIKFSKKSNLSRHKKHFIPEVSRVKIFVRIVMKHFHLRDCFKYM